MPLVDPGRPRPFGTALVVGLLSTALFAEAACTGTAGNERFTFAAEAGATTAESAPGAPFVNEFGWSVALTIARLRLGPVYLNTVAPLRASRGFRFIREAHADEAHLGSGLIVGEVLGDLEVDLLGSALQPFGRRGLVTGDLVRTAEIRFWPGPGIDPGSPTLDPVLVVAGSATLADETIPFEGQLLLDETWLPNAEPGDRNFLTLSDIRQVRGVPTSFVADEGGTLEIRVDPRRLFATANFAQIRANPTSPRDPSVRLLTQASGTTGTTDQVMRSLYDALRSIRTYEVRWRPR